MPVVTGQAALIARAVASFPPTVNVKILPSAVGVGIGLPVPFAGQPYSVTVEVSAVGVGSGFVEEVIHTVAHVRMTMSSEGVGIGLPAATVVIDNGDTITPNAGYIFTENSVTRTLTDKEIALGLDPSGNLRFTIIRAVRQGNPDYRFQPWIETFSRRYAVDVNSTRANFAARVQRLNRLGYLEKRFGAGATVWAQAESTKQGQFFGLGDPPTGVIRRSNDDPIFITRIMLTDGFVACPGTSSGLDIAPIQFDRRAYYVTVESEGGRVFVTTDGRECTESSYDRIVGAEIAFGSGGGAGGEFRIDEFETMPTDGSFTEEDEERFMLLGFNRPSGGSTTTERGRVEGLRCHPSEIRIMSPDPGATYRVFIERVGDHF